MGKKGTHIDRVFALILAVLVAGGSLVFASAALVFASTAPVFAPAAHPAGHGANQHCRGSANHDGTKKEKIA